MLGVGRQSGEAEAISAARQVCQTQRFIVRAEITPSTNTHRITRLNLRANIALNAAVIRSFCRRAMGERGNESGAARKELRTAFNRAEPNCP